MALIRDHVLSMLGLANETLLTETIASAAELTRARAWANEAVNEGRPLPSGRTAELSPREITKKRKRLTTAPVTRMTSRHTANNLAEVIRD
jgi:hypothetical protein